MTDQFFSYSDTFVNFTLADKKLISAALTFKQVEAKTALVLSDNLSDELFFILKGCVRKYYLKDGEHIDRK